MHTLHLPPNRDLRKLLITLAMGILNLARKRTSDCTTRDADKVY